MELLGDDEVQDMLVDEGYPIELVDAAITAIENEGTTISYTAGNCTVLTADEVEVLRDRLDAAMSTRGDAS